MERLKSSGYTRPNNHEPPSCPLWSGLAWPPPSLPLALQVGPWATVPSLQMILRSDYRSLESTSVSLASLQWQLTSLAQVALQNRRALDLLTTEKGDTCLFLREKCCYYINESGLVEQNSDTLSHLSEEIQLRRTKNSLVLDWTQSPPHPWLLPFLAPLIVVFTFLSFLPCILKSFIYLFIYFCW
jgi:hypothetical protein